MTSLISEIERLGELRETGLLTDVEFHAAKARLLENSGEMHGTTFVTRCPSCGAGIVGTLAEQARATHH